MRNNKIQRVITFEKPQDLSLRSNDNTEIIFLTYTKNYQN